MEIINIITLSGKIEAPVQLMEAEGYHVQCLRYPRNSNASGRLSG